MDFCKLVSRYKQFGGIRLLWEYAKFGVLPVVFCEAVRCVVNRQSFKYIYPKVLERIEPMLVAKYSSAMHKSFLSLQGKNFNHEHPKLIWWCWLQGLNNAPQIVKACYNSIKIHFKDWDVRIIDELNWSEYIELPNYIVVKWNKGRIPPALFSDIIRLELLIKYGGSWIDSTVLCTGIVEGYMDFLTANLFMFQYSKQNSVKVSISNWFITSCSNHEALIVLRDTLYTYWKDFECTIDYYIFHLFFSLLSKDFPEIIAMMPYGQSMNCLALLYHLGDNFNLQKWDSLIAKVCFHKLSFRVSNGVKENIKSYYNFILKEYGHI